MAKFFDSAFLQVAITMSGDMRRCAERRGVIASCFAENYFCCLGTNCTLWKDLCDLIDRLAHSPEVKLCHVFNVHGCH